MQRETKQSIGVLALVFAIFAFAGYGYAATANYTNVSNIYNYSLFNNSGINYSGTNLYNYYNNGTFQSIGYDIIANVLYFEYHNVSFNSAGFEHNNSTIYNNYNNSVIDNINQLNSTITNYFNYTNYDHALLQNLSYSASGHTGFESSSHASTTYETISNVGALGTAYRFHEHQSPFGGALGNGGQVSYTDLKNLPDLSLKANKSNESFRNISNINQSNTLTIWSDTNLPLDIIAVSNPAIPRYYSYNNASIIGNYFVGLRGRGNYSVPSKILRGDSMFRVAGGGQYTGGMSGSRAWIDFIASENFENSSVNGAQVDIHTTKNGTNVLRLAASFGEDANLTVSGLVGSGYAYACLDSSGKFIRSSVQCDLI